MLQHMSSSLAPSTKLPAILTWHGTLMSAWQTGVDRLAPLHYTEHSMHGAGAYMYWWRDGHQQQLAAAVHCCCLYHSLIDRLRAASVAEQVDGLLERSSAPPAGEEPGPDTELEHWRQQMSRLNSLTEQLKSHECRLVLGVTSMAHSQVGKAAHSGPARLHLPQQVHAANLSVPPLNAHRPTSGGRGWSCA